MTEKIAKTDGCTIQWQNEGEGAILMEPFSNTITLTQHDDCIHIEVGSINEFVKNLRQAQKEAIKKSK